MLKDNGQRQQYETGAQREQSQGKGNYALISPVFVERLAKQLEAGALKYSDRNWELGRPLSSFMDSAVRHLFQFLEGDRDEDHLAAAAFNIMGLIHTEEMIKRGRLPKTLADLPNYQKRLINKKRPKQQ